RRWQAFISLGLAAVVTLATLGIAPTPSAIRRALGAAPFPCEVHACGCTSAADCFDSCCCFTPAELDAWRRDQAQAAPAARPPAQASVEPGAGDPEPPAPGGDDHCELCRPPPAPEPAAPPESPTAAPAFALISALACRAVELSIVWAPPLLAAPPAFALPVTPAVGTARRPAARRAAPAPPGRGRAPPPGGRLRPLPGTALALRRPPRPLPVSPATGDTSRARTPAPRAPRSHSSSCSSSSRSSRC